MIIIVFFILTDSHYFIKDSSTGVTILEGQSEGGLYPQWLQHFSLNKQPTLVALIGVKVPLRIW